MTIRLVEGSSRLLGAMSEKASATASEDLGSLMVDVTLGHVMKSFEDGVVTLDDGTAFNAGIVVWTAGVKAVPVNITGHTEDCIYGRGGRIVTDDRCRVKGLGNVYAVGDIGIFTDDMYPQGLPQLAQVAIQEGRFVARCLNRGDWSSPFRYSDRGSMATIGRNKAVADIRGLRLKGWAGWMAWMFIHLVSLMGMRSKLSVLLNWTWSYFTYNTALRILLRGSMYPLRKMEG